MTDDEMALAYARDQARLRQMRRLLDAIDEALNAAAGSSESVRLKLIAARNEIDSESAHIVARWD